jgi:hypothetical protein
MRLLCDACGPLGECRANVRILDDLTIESHQWRIR